MKRIILVFFALIFSVSAIAEGIDFSELTDDELYSAKNAIEAELAARELTGSVISPGVYVAGKDIRSGTWKITAVGEDRVTIGCIVYADDETRKKAREAASSNDLEGKLASNAMAKFVAQLNEGESCNISLSDGMTLDIVAMRKGSTCIIQEAENSFAP